MIKKISRVVVLGSNSFIAKDVIKKIKRKKIKLKLITRKEINFHNKTQCKKLQKILRENDTIFFAAAKAPVKNFNMLMYNLQMCQNIIDAVKYIKYKHFIYLSSDAVYKDSSDPINEKSLTEPDSFHGLMHLTREKLIKYQLNHNLSIIRPTLVFGEGDPHNGYGPNLFLRNALENNSIYLFGKGEEKRDHVYISDVGRIISEIIINKYFGVFNITSGQTITFYEIAKKISKKFNNRIPIHFKKRIGPMPHNGYRAFSNRLKIDKFRKFKYTTIDNWLNNLKI